MVRALALSICLAATAIGCGAGDPGPTFWAPDDLASVLPRQVAELDLELEGSGGSDYLVEALGEDAHDILLTCQPPVVRCRPDAVRFALASSSSEAHDVRLVVFALRVEGVPAMDLAAAIDSGPFVLVTPADAAGYEPITRNLARPGQGWLDLYPLGEVLFGAVATADGLGVDGDDFDATMPSCRRYGREPCRGPSRGPSPGR